MTVGISNHTIYNHLLFIVKIQNKIQITKQYVNEDSSI